MLVVSTVLFTTVSGLGPVIMLGTIVLPILASIGVREHVASGVLLFGIALGGLLNPGNWTMYRSVLGVGQEVVSAYAVALFGIAAAGSVGFVTLEMWRTRAVRFGRSALVTALIGVGWWLASRGTRRAGPVRRGRETDGQADRDRRGTRAVRPGRRGGRRPAGVAIPSCTGRPTPSRWCPCS